MGNFGHIPKIDRSPHYFVASARHFGGSGLLFHWRSRKSWDQHFFIPEQKNI
jgi:hypothetical protein